MSRNADIEHDDDCDGCNCECEDGGGDVTIGAPPAEQSSGIHSDR